jgi:phage tail-like protein
MAQPKANPIRNFRFKMEVKGLGDAQFTDVAGFNATTDVIEYRTGVDKEIRKFPGITKYGNITLKRAVTSVESDFWKLMRDYVETGAGKPDQLPKFNGTLSAVDYATDSVLASWEFTNAFPMKYTAPDFTAKGNDVGIESMELVVEKIKRSK